MARTTPMNESSTSDSKFTTSKMFDFFSRLAKAREFTLVAMIIVMAISLHLITGGFFDHFNLEEARTTGKFFRQGNLNAMALGFSTSAIIVFGMTAALASGGFDLSVGSVFALGGVTAATALKADLSIPIAAMCGIGAGMCAGLVNGLLITKIQINPFITTLGMMGIARGISLAVTEGSVLAGLPSEFFVYGQNRTFDIPNLVLIALFVIFVGDFLMRRSSMFRQIYYVGGNEEAARLSGIHVDRVKIGVFVLSASLAAFAGVLSVSRFTVADPGAGQGEELRIIAACIIGGCSLNGGKGTVIGGLFGLIFVGLVNNGLILLRVPVYWQQLSMGVVLILAVGFDTLSQRWQLRPRGTKAG